MARWVTATVSMETVDVPTPPVRFTFTRIRFPTIGPFELPDIHTDPVSVDLPDVEIPHVSFTVPVPSVGRDRIDLGSVGPIFIPSGVTANLRVLWTRPEILGVEFPVRVPYFIQLIGPSLTWMSIGPFDLGQVTVPDVSFSDRRISFGGQVFRLPTISVPGLDIDIPDIPTFDLPDVRVPDGASLRGSLSVPRPASITVDVSVEWAEVRQFALEPLPTWATSSDPFSLVEAVLSGIESNLTDSLLRRVKRIADAALEVALSEETKERLREQARE